jgi:hypothetical protein
LTSVEYGFRPDDSILLESKEAMKRRGMASPDDGDALAMTFAQPVAEFMGGEDIPKTKSKARDYDPYALV